MELEENDLIYQAEAYTLGKTSSQTVYSEKTPEELCEDAILSRVP